MTDHRFRTRLAQPTGLACVALALASMAGCVTPPEPSPSVAVVCDPEPCGDDNVSIVVIEE